VRVSVIIPTHNEAEAIARVPRELFVTGGDRRRAYANRALPIDCGQTISQPLVVGRMCELLELRETDRVLEIGTGSGYHAAVLAQLAGHVWSVETHAEHGRHATEGSVAENGLRENEAHSNGTAHPVDVPAQPTDTDKQ